MNSVNQSIDNTHFKTFKHVRHAVPSNVSSVQLRKAIQQRLHDKVPKLPHKKPYMRKIFERVPGCFFQDLLEQPRGSDPQYYHIFIGTNNRYAFAYPINDKSAETAVDTLRQFISDNHGKPIIKLTSDGERAFTSDIFINECHKHQIMVKIVPDKAHSTLGIVDRFVRTLRDMNQPQNKSQEQQYDQDYIIFTREKMRQLITSYNNAHHNSIGCSPKKMYDNADLENEYIAKCLKQRNIQNAIIDFNLDPGTFVRYRMVDYDLAGHKRRSQISREKYCIDRRIGSRYVLQAPDGKKITKSRFELVKADEDDPLGLTFQQNQRVNPESVYTGILYH